MACVRGCGETHQRFVVGAIAEPIADRANGVIDQVFGQVDASPVVGMRSAGEMRQQILADRVPRVTGPHLDGAKILKRQRMLERGSRSLQRERRFAMLPA